MAGRNKKLVPECQAALNQLKYEVASELGVAFGGGSYGGTGEDTEFAGDLGSIASSGSGKAYLGSLSSREAGSVGGEITKRLIRSAQQTVL
ncbi:small, acid-soluble spore protein, alpha/beta type [Cohnella faecalis]|uniref:Small acid-soluble spore protein n=1 Tax=Cohnella faecalis TaxID=2315694 RepID=A0A398CI55_9BACL|nr:alpha/beta-type small acid-soluble spore protein [Cohnella faecalis]RIE02035.1 small acid-soluble spore protein [Cohnella faecalis]